MNKLTYAALMGIAVSAKSPFSKATGKAPFSKLRAARLSKRKLGHDEPVEETWETTEWEMEGMDDMMMEDWNMDDMNWDMEDMDMSEWEDEKDWDSGNVDVGAEMEMWELYLFPTDGDLSKIWETYPQITIYMDGIDQTNNTMTMWMNYVGDIDYKQFETCYLTVAVDPEMEYMPAADVYVSHGPDDAYSGCPSWAGSTI